MEAVILNNQKVKRNRGGNKRNKYARSGIGSQERRLPNRLDAAQFKEPTSVTFPMNIVGFPDRLVTILKYSEAYTFSAAASPSVQQWNLNSAFDPNQTGTGHQPSFFDTFSGIYSRYYVRAFKLEAVIQNSSNTGVYGVMGYADQSIGSNSVEAMTEAKYAVMMTLGQQTGMATKRVNLPWMHTHKLMGQPYAEADDNMYASTGASPNDIAWGYMRFAAVDSITNITVYARVIVYMEIAFKDLLPQVTS